MENIDLINSFSEFKEDKKYRQGNTNVYIGRSF